MEKLESDSSFLSSSSYDRDSGRGVASLAEEKNAAAQTQIYEDCLAEAGIYMDGGPGITNACRTLCQSLLETKQPRPPDSLFRDSLFKNACETLHNGSKASIMRDISPLLVPSIRDLYSYGEDYLESMIDHINVEWYSCIPILYRQVPQPDYCVGCGATVFTKEQRQKLEPLIGGWKGTPFLVSSKMYFPYLTVEVVGGNELLQVADRLNSHSAGIAISQVVELYRAVSRQDELNRKILVFSVSHNQRCVRIYGHYPVIEGDESLVYRHTVAMLDISSKNCKDKWKAYRFTRNLYDIFGPIHIERLRSAVDQLPGL